MKPQHPRLSGLISCRRRVRDLETRLREQKQKEEEIEQEMLEDTFGRKLHHGLAFAWQSISAPAKCMRR